jgi:hypothetical protein
MKFAANSRYILERRSNERDLLGDRRSGDIEASCWNTPRIERSEGMDLVEESTNSET